MRKTRVHAIMLVASAFGVHSRGTPLITTARRFASRSHGLLVKNRAISMIHVNQLAMILLLKELCCFGTYPFGVLRTELITHVGTK